MLPDVEWNPSLIHTETALRGRDFRERHGHKARDLANGSEEKEKEVPIENYETDLVEKKRAHEVRFAV